MITEPKTLTPVKTIMCGDVSRDALFYEIQNKGVGYYAEGVMHTDAFTVAKTQEEYNLVFLAIGEDLGFTQEPYSDEFMTTQFCADWSARYLDGQAIEPCFGEDAAQLFRQDDSVFAENIWMAMKPVPGFEGSMLGSMFVFGIVYDIGEGGYPYLQASHDSGAWPLDTLVVYRLRNLT